MGIKRDWESMVLNPMDPLTLSKECAGAHDGLGPVASQKIQREQI
jgi:hypothetical protein